MLYTARKEAPDLERGLTPFTVRVPHKAPVYFLINYCGTARDSVPFTRLIAPIPLGYHIFPVEKVVCLSTP